MTEEQNKSKENKRICRFCNSNKYEGQYSKHLNKEHRSILKKREQIKNITRAMGEEQLQEIFDHCLEIRKSLSIEEKPCES